MLSNFAFRAYKIEYSKGCDKLVGHFGKLQTSSYENVIFGLLTHRWLLLRAANVNVTFGLRQKYSHFCNVT